MGRSPTVCFMAFVIWLCSTLSFSSGHSFSANYSKVSAYQNCEAAGPPERHRDAGSDHAFTQYLFSQQWTTTLCRGDQFSCDGHKDVKPWTIHGLWPNKRGDKKGPTKCNQYKHFKKDSVKELLPRLEREWPNLKRNSHDRYKLWKHEWKEHGTCCPESLGKVELYFGKVLDLYENGLNFEDILKSAGIVPSSNATYSVDQILSAFGKGVVNKVICSTHETNNSKGVPHLMEIRICLSKDTFERCQCKQQGRTSILSCGSADDPKDIQVMYEPARD